MKKFCLLIGILITTLHCSEPKKSTNPVVRILPLGNSVTYDDYKGDVRPAGQRVAYRIHLYRMLKAGGYNFDFVGSETSGQDLFPDPQNGGFSGINKDQLVTLLRTGYNPRTDTQVTNGPYLDSYQPDVILLHIGTNDVSTDITAINEILDIIDTFRNQSGKDTKLLIAKIINRRIYDPTTTQFNKNLENAVVAHNNSNNHVVDMENDAGIDYSNEMNDNLHPNSEGYKKMAALWFKVLTGILDPPFKSTRSWEGHRKQNNGLHPLKSDTCTRMAVHRVVSYQP